jgi:anti-sigma factor RsiW
MRVPRVSRNVMSCDDCTSLDDFLLGELPADAASRFAAHLGQCAACREAVDQQRWIDGLLTSPIVHELESAPDWLGDSLRTRVLARRRRARLVACVFAAAAAVVFAVGWTELNRQALDDAAPGGVAGNTPANLIEPPRATFVGGPDVLVVPVASRHSNVTIVRVYPAYRPSYDTQVNAERFEQDGLKGG